MSMDLTLPELLPDGSTLLKDADFDKRLHYGDATVGWNGDMRLGVYFAAGCLEIRRLCEDGELRVVGRSRPGARTLDTEVLRQLAAHDSQRRGGYDVRADIDATRARLDADKQRATDAKFEEAADKLHFALRRDVGAHNGGLTKRQFTLGAAPWLKDKE